MIPNDFQMPKQEEREFELIPDDVYESVIKDIEQITSHFKTDEGEEKQVFKFTFKIADDGTYHGRLIWKEVSPHAYYGKKGATILLQIINAVRKVDATEQEAKNISAKDINELIGQRIRCSIGHAVSGQGREYNKVTGFLPSKVSDTDGAFSPL